MKQKKFTKKLVLNKQTIADLAHPQMKGVKGGGTYTCYPCTIYDSVCPTCPDGGGNTCEPPCRPTDFPCTIFDSVCPTCPDGGGNTCEFPCEPTLGC